MADVFTRLKRSAIMSRIRSSGNEATELRTIAILRANHISGWRRRSHLFGRPDFVFKDARVVVFVDGCFWHGCPHHSQMPGSNRKYWGPKLTRNRERDKDVNRVLKKEGWNVIRLWQHELAKPTQVARKIKRAVS